MTDLKLAIKTQTFRPRDGGDLLKILNQAKENSLRVKQYGGVFPATSEGAEVLISLECMKRIVWYDPEEQTLTVEGGLTLGELLKRMEYVNYTLELYGILPNMTVADAISIGLMGSNGTIAQCLKACQVLQPDGTLVEWTWPDFEHASDEECAEDRNYIPTLQSLICGLGVVGIITSATLHCVPLHLAQEVTYECSIGEVLENMPQLSESLYHHFYWFPLLNKTVVTKTYPMRIHQSFSQPWWKSSVEVFLKSLYRLVNWASPFLSWYIPSVAKPLSRIQFDLMTSSSSQRTHFCFKPQVIISVSSYCRGIKWAFPAHRLQNVVNEIEEWSEENFFLCSTPVLISSQTHLDIHRPYLCPYTEKNTCTLWTDWFNTKNINLGYSASMAEFEAILQKNNGRKCWSAGPIFASPLIGQMYPGFRHWCQMRNILDPGTMFRSAYVEGELFVEN